ncbi:MAG: hypothetical protein NTZ87_01005 [Candidatus Nomurabacteria bacterium]|nr:hypothetical protein [Candidatus Nomurabacteria bacterium]
MQSFSQLLVERIQKYFKQKYNLDISDGTANEYLHTLGGMFAVFAESDGGKPPPDPIMGTGGGNTASDISLSH